MLVTLNDILPLARKKRFAVGAFNTSDLEITQAIITAAQGLNSPVIIAVSEKAIQYAGLEELSALIISLAKKAKIPVVLHLDHGPSYELASACIKSGFTSVMIDASHFEFEKNLAVTRQVVEYAHRRKVSVEAEIGRLAGIEDNVNIARSQALFTDPREAKRFAAESGCDALAIAIGTSHGAYKFKGKPRLRIDVLKEIAGEVKIPLVLHGASTVKKKWVDNVNSYGGLIEHARGMTDALLRQAIHHGIAKINVDTDLRIAFTAGIREHLSENPRDFDPRKSIGAGKEKIIKVVEERIQVFGSTGQG